MIWSSEEINEKVKNYTVQLLLINVTFQPQTKNSLCRAM